MIPTYLDLQLGLGDLIISNGLIRELSKRIERLVVPCYDHSWTSAQAMFSDLDNVQFCTANAQFEKKLVIGQNNPRFGSYASYDRAMYSLADVPFECRWDSFHVPESSIPIKDLSKPFRLFHHDTSRNFSIKDSYFDLNGDIVVFKTKAVTDWIPFIEKADEIHCIDSSILHLVESVETKGKLFFHKYARPHTPFGLAVLKKNWTVIE